MRVLIADDDWLSAQALETDLRAIGYEVTVVGDGSEAWQILKEEERPQIAILDWRMPIMDGLEVCRRVRQAGGPYVYILLLTGNVDSDSAVKGMDAGHHVSDRSIGVSPLGRERRASIGVHHGSD